MLKIRIRRVAVLAVCALLALAAASCVRAKPEREREPLPTLPVTVSQEAEAEGEALALAEPGESAETEAEIELAGEAAEPAQGEEPQVAEEEAAEAQAQEPAVTVAVIAAPEPTPELPPYDGPLYVVQPGDTLASIALLHASTVTAFMEANGLSNSAAIAPGQELRLPPSAVRYDPEQLSTYVIRSGDTLGQIAAWHRMSVEQLRGLNPQITDASFLRAGAKLTVLIQPIPEGATVHTVQRGDTLASIAGRYGVSVYDLAQANHISDANRLDVGQQLVIPQ
jgi:LysM repeat protein